MNIHKTITAAALAVIALVGSSVTAQTSDSVTRRFNLSNLLEKRGKIQIGVNVPTSIEFDEPIVESLVGRDDLLIDGVSKAKPNRMYFRAKEVKGSSSIDITLEGGATALFTFEINPKITEGLRYVIKGKSDGSGEDSGSLSPQASTPSGSAKPGAPTASKPANPQPQAKPGTQPASANNPPAGQPAAEPAPASSAVVVELQASQPVTPASSPVAEIASTGASKPATTGKPSTIALGPTVNGVRHYDSRLERPEDIGVYFTLKNSDDAQLEFELLIENRGMSSVEFDPTSMNVYVFGNASPTNSRTSLYLTLAPKFDLRSKLEIEAGGSLTRRFSLKANLDPKMMFEYVADFALIRDLSSVQFRRSVLR